MGRKLKVTDNEIVAEWLIQNRWRDSLTAGTKQRMPSFVEDAVYAAVYIVAGVSNGKVNISPKLVFKALMLKDISSESVRKVEVGYEMNDRTARRLAQTARFALDAIKHRIQEYEEGYTEEEKMSWRLEKEFIDDYYNQRESRYYSPPAQPLPSEIESLRKAGKYLEYGAAIIAFKSK